MKLETHHPPRAFTVGQRHPITLKDCACIRLEPDEQVTFLTPGGGEYDVVRTAWGFYATPSLNGRLRQFGLRGVLIRSSIGRYFVWLVEAEREMEFQQYLETQGHRVVAWLDTDEALQQLEQRMHADD
jgi:hypothetical protein